MFSNEIENYIRVNNLMKKKTTDDVEGFLWGQSCMTIKTYTDSDIVNVIQLQLMLCAIPVETD